MSVLRLLLLVSLLLVVVNGTVVEWGHAKRTGFLDVASPIVLPAQVLSSLSNGSALPEFTHIASNEYMTVGMTSLHEFYLWGLVGTAVQAPRKLILPSSFPLTSSDPVMHLIGADNFFFAKTASGKVYSWTWSGTTCPNSGLFGRSFTAPNDCSVPTVIPSAVQLPGLVENTPASTTGIACASSYCLAHDATEVLAWSANSDNFNSSFSYLIDPSLPTNLSPATPTMVTINFAAASKDWFFIVTSNATDPIRVWSFGIGTTDGRFLNPSVVEGTHYHFLPSSTHLGFGGMTPSFAAAGLNHGILASTSQVFCWGSNSHGQLSAPKSLLNSSSPYAVSLPGGTVINGVSAVGHTSYLLSSNGEIFVWGASSLCASYQCEEYSYGFFGDIRLSIAGFEGAIKMNLPDGFSANSLPTASHSLDQNIYAFHLIGSLSSSPSSSQQDLLGQEVLIGWGRTAEGELDLGIPTGNLKNSDSIPVSEPSVVSLPSNISKIHAVRVRGHSIRTLIQVGDSTEIHAWGEMTGEDVSVPSLDPQNIMSIASLPYPVSPYLDEDVMGISSSSEIVDIASIDKRFYVRTANGNLTSYWKGTANSIFSGLLPLDQLICGDTHCAIYKQDTQSIFTFMADRSPGLCYPTGRSTCMEAPTLLPTSDPVLAVGLGDEFTVVLLDTATDYFQVVGACYWYNGCMGDLSVWYRNSLTAIDSSLLPSINPSEIFSLTVGAQHVMFLFNSSGNVTQLAGWGWNDAGQVGGSTDDALAPHVISSSWYEGTPLVVSAVTYSTFMLTDMGGGVQKVWVWGFNGWPRFLGSFQDTMDTRYASQALHFQLPSALQPTLGSYSIKSLPYSPGGKSLFMVLTKNADDQQIAPGDLWRNPLDLSSHSFIVAHGDDTAYVQNSGMATIFPNMWAPTTGTPLPLGEGTGSGMYKGIPSGETITQIALGNYVHWYLTDAHRLYAAGYVTALPPFVEANTDITEYTTWQQFVPLLFFDATSYGGGNVLKIEAYARSVVVLLQNGTALSFYGGSNFDHEVGLELNEYIDGVQDLPFQISGGAVYDDVSCNPNGCCLLSQLRQVVDCYGVFPGSTSSYLYSGIPTITLSGQEFSQIHLLNQGLVYRTKDGEWHMKNGTSDTLITGAMPLGATVVQAAKSSHHLVILTGYGLMYSYGESQYGQGNSTCGVDAFCSFHHDHSDAQGVVQVATWGSTTIWMSSPSYKMFASGIRFWQDGARDLISEQLSHPSIFTPTQVPFNTDYSVIKLFSRSSFSFDSDQVNRLVLVSAVVGPRPPSVDPTFEPFQPPPQASPVPVQTVPPTVAPPSTAQPMAPTCAGTPPFASCLCNSDLTWHCKGSFNTSQSITISAPIIIEGDLTVNTPGGLVIDATTIFGGRTAVIVEGCFLLLEPISVLFNEDAAVRGVPSKGFKELRLVDSPCARLATTALLTIQQTERKCRNVSGGGKVSSSEGRALLSGLFNVTKDTCDYWWIILVSALGAAIVAVAIIVLVFTQSKYLRQKVQPYRGSN